jgi:hypothetical protein
MTSNDPHISPTQTITQRHSEPPIYIHNSHRLTPPLEGEEQRNDGSQRIFSDPLTGRKGVSNDARHWDPSFAKRSSENQPYEKQPYEKQSYAKPTFEKPPPNAPFIHDENARVNHKSSTYYYSKNALARTLRDSNESREFYVSRTLYVTGANIDDFTSHHLKELMSRYGTVDGISYLYPNPENGAAFIM